jgi:SAM-dependent methyltransferase
MKNPDIYYGKTATQYDKRRKGTPGWKAEQAAVEALVGSGTVLDCPLGTGRFIPIYQAKGLDFEGVDISPDMVRVARENYPGISARVASIFDLPYEDGTFDVSVCCRMAWWLSADNLVRAVAELKRVSRVVVLSIRIGQPGIPEGRNTMTHTEAQLQAALDGWKVDRRITIFDNRTGCYQFVRASA